MQHKLQKQEPEACIPYGVFTQNRDQLMTYPSHCLRVLFLLPVQFLLVLVVQLLFSEGKTQKHKKTIICIIVQFSTIAKKIKSNIHTSFNI